MTAKTRRRIIVVVTLLALPVWAGHSLAAQRRQIERYPLKGVVKSVDKAKRRATIQHEKVGDLMSAMTMPFPIKDNKALNEMKPGDQITATLVTSNGGISYLEKITIIARGEKESTADLDPEQKPVRLMGTAANNRAPVEVAEPSRYKEINGFYTCVMHLDVRVNAPGKCPKCGMELISTEPLVADEFDLTMEVLPRVPQPGQKTRLRFAVFNPRTGELVKKLALMHDKLFHLFLVSQDLSDFQHIHPQQAPDGSFIIDAVLKRPGLYKVYSDLYPLEGAPQVLQGHLTTAGWGGDLMGGQAQLVPDSVMIKTADATPITRENAERLGVDISVLVAQQDNDLKAELKLEPSTIISGQPVTLKYRLADVKTGQPVRNLTPYLGAWGHMLILSEDQTTVLHSHPEQQINPEEDATTRRGGPELTFDALFPAPGNYRIWAQFLRGRRLNTVAFDVNVKRL